MKKIFTMCLGLVFTAAAFAADKRPDVTIITMKKYEIVIDGRSYFSNSSMMYIDNLCNGRHSMQVFEMNRGFSIFKRKQLVASQSFRLRNKDVKIIIDRTGCITITEDRFDHDNGYGKDQRGWSEKNPSMNDRDGKDFHENHDDHDDHHKRF